MSLLLGIRPAFVRGDDAHLLELLSSVADRNGVSVHRLKYGGRTHVLVQMRREFAKSARNLGYSLPQIGWALGCHHSSVLHLVRT